MTPASQLKRDIAYHAKIAMIEIERCQKLLAPELEKNRSTYLLSPVEVRKLNQAIKAAVKCIQRIMVSI